MTATGTPVRVARETGHVCWVVDDRTDYVTVATAVLADGVTAGRKPLVFGPRGSASLAALAAAAAVAADPAADFLPGGRLAPDVMFAMFREQTALARAEGYTGLCLVADMDWLHAAGPGAEAVVAFELLLDAVVQELGAVVVCAYRVGSFDGATIDGAACVHPGVTGTGEPAPFALVAAGPGRWRLSGEVDFSVEPAFATAVRTAVESAARGECVLDLTGLAFVDVAGLRALARAIGARPVTVRGASPAVRRWWALGRFADAAPGALLLA